MANSLSVVTKTSNPAASASFSKSPFSNCPQPRARASSDRMMLKQITGKGARCAVTKQTQHLAPSSVSNPTAFQAVSFERNSTRMRGWRNIDGARTRSSI